MKILYNRYLDKNRRLFIPIERYAPLDGPADGEPSHIKLLNVNEEKTTMVAYSDFKKHIETGALTQIL